MLFLGLWFLVTLAWLDCNYFCVKRGDLLLWKEKKPGNRIGCFFIVKIGHDITSKKVWRKRYRVILLFSTECRFIIAWTRGKTVELFYQRNHPDPNHAIRILNQILESTFAHRNTNRSKWSFVPSVHLNLIYPILPSILIFSYKELLLSNPL